MARRDRDSRRIAQAIDLLERLLRRVSIEYEMYFLGVSKKAPTDKARELKKLFLELEETTINNTSLAFRAKVVRSRYTSHRMKWLRIMKKIDDGTYHKHRVMADIRAKARGADAGKTDGELRAEIRSLIRGEAVGDEGAPADASRGKGKRGASGHSVGSDALVDEYREVRRRLGESDKVNRKALEKRLSKHADEVKKKTGCKEVRFQVVEENGRSKVKVFPVR